MSRGEEDPGARAVGCGHGVHLNESVTVRRGLTLSDPTGADNVTLMPAFQNS